MKHVCIQCESAFYGRKKKYCSPACAAERKRQIDRERSPNITGRSRRQPTTIVNGKRECLHCQKEKELQLFVIGGRSKSGYRSICKSCDRKRLNNKSARQRMDKAILKRQDHGTQSCDIECAEGYKKIAHQLNDDGTVKKEFQKTYAPAAIKLKSLTPKAKRKAISEEMKKMGRLAQKNAVQAFDHHLRVKASDQWVRNYFEAIGMPWKNPRLSEAEAWRIRYWADPEFNVRQRMRNQTRKALRKDGIAEVMRSAIKRHGTSPSTEKLLGYSIKELTDHLERQFTRGMNWEAFRSGQIHIDHIIPKACFDFTKEGEWEACWALSNLRPCWAGENISKSAKRLHLI